MSKRKKYKIIYADPAWKYKDKMHAGERGVEYKYSTMTLAETCALPIRSISDDNSRLFMWTTMPLLFDAKEVMNAWGFKYKTLGFCWIKTYPKAERVIKEINKLFKEKHNKKEMVSVAELLPFILELCFMGNGSYTRSNPELCLIGTRGKVPRINAGVRSVVISPIGDEHSAKPPEVRDRIVKLYGDVSRVELFARGDTVPGWDFWGNDATTPVNLFDDVQHDEIQNKSLIV